VPLLGDREERGTAERHDAERGEQPRSARQQQPDDERERDADAGEWVLGERSDDAAGERDPGDHRRARPRPDGPPR